MHMMNREIIPGSKKRVRRCTTVTVADILFSSVKVMAVLTWLKQIELLHPAPVGAKPDSMPCLEGVSYK